MCIDLLRSLQRDIPATLDSMQCNVQYVVLIEWLNQLSEWALQARTKLTIEIMQKKSHAVAQLTEEIS